MRSVRPHILFAHGAGAGSSHPWMQAWTSRLGGEFPVTTFDYPYMRAGKRRPDPHPTLVDAHGDALRAINLPDGHPIILAGKSMGSRIGCHLSVAPPRPVAGLVCFGYPLVAIRGDKVRDAILRQLTVPILFVQGTRDRMCPLEHLDQVRSEMNARAEVHVVETGDHSLLTTKTWQKQTGRTQDDVDHDILLAVRDFIMSLGSTE